VGLINLILDLAGVLLWFHWRTLYYDRNAQSPGVSLLATLKRAEAGRPSQGSPIVGLTAILVLRSIFYWHMGPAASWTPCVQFGALALPFRSDFLNRMMVFSLVSFALTLGTAYLWLLLFSTLGPKGSEGDLMFRWVRLQLGWVSRWPLAAKLLLPWLVGTALWYATNPLWIWLGIMPHPLSSAHRWQQAVVIGLGAYLVWRDFIVMLLSLYLLNSYVYLGNYSFWASVNAAARNLLRPMSWLPVRLGTFDFTAPVVIAIVIAVDQFGRTGLPWLYERLPF
jgi:hypothetical protein